ncbi:gamma-glutamyl-gamma-aminobutyrate hydrolase family protein [Listeria grandensis]|uniref:gamma-glutamyl-gamma-aminobutyrate hydrolase family protein n=1 Tax=Listeria grandensis TaxID=1494963 RepID=UPI00164E862C|nr:gamma-glutamyl-gamma-aminobutyrate hydrolase family protein [Listeria grandensis]MBC6315990.1 gamma-glutamyl-gamma-aminobutyrate hydrolase family protein [Listeria grandensis]
MTAIIGISAAVLAEQVPNTISRNGTYVGGDYVSVIAKSGAAPFVIPVTDTGLVTTFVNQMDGLILSGGQDVSPALYGALPQAKLGVTSIARDIFELALLKETLAQKKPILAICRGAQLLNIAFGGTLHQDTSYIRNANLEHMQRDQATRATHSIQIEKNSQLYSILGSTAQVNSFHHQAVDILGAGLKITATAPDGVVEAIEKPGVPFVIGVQWHPELIAENDIGMQRMFQEFVKSAERGSIKQIYNAPPIHLKKRATLR